MNTGNDILHLQDKINGIKFKSCEQIRVGDMLHYILNDDITWSVTIKSLLRMVKNNFFNHYTYSVSGSPDMVMLFSTSYRSRFDHFSWFQNVCQTYENHVQAVAGKPQLRKWDNLHTFQLVISWIRQFMGLRMNFQRSIYFTSVLHQGYCDYNRLTAFLSKKQLDIHYAATVCDVMPVDSFFVQQWNQSEISTITFQHGIYKRGAYAYTHSISQYFLANSQFSVDNAIASGLKPENLFAVGAPQNINAVVRTPKKKQENRIIGLFLGGGRSKGYDIELLKMVKRFALEHGYKIYVKMHPGYKVEEYSYNIKENVDKIFDTEIHAYEFADLVEITIDDGSTLFVEFLLQGRVSFTYINEENPYKDIKDLKMGFSNYERMEKLILMNQNMDKSLQAMMESDRKYLGTEKEPFELYQTFFRNLVEKR